MSANSSKKEQLSGVRDWKISAVMDETGCNRDTAIQYLGAEEWIVPEAIFSLAIDVAISFATGKRERGKR